MKFYSELLSLENQIDETEIFDPSLDEDSNYFINIILLKNTEIPEFKDSYKKVNKRFQEILKLLKLSKEKNDKTYREALRRFDFPEVNGISLGYAKGKHGSGFGKTIQEIVISDAKEIVDLGENDPEIFHLLGLFEEKVGPDKISDMIASLIGDDIIKYTKRINKELNITPKNYRNLTFNNGIVKNPYKNFPVLILPKEIIHELPVAKSWEDIDEVCSKIKQIKEEMNKLIGDEWEKESLSMKKKYLKKMITTNKEIYKEIIIGYKNAKIKKYDFDKDPKGEYLLPKKANQIVSKNPLDKKMIVKNDEDFVLLIINKFKDLLENNKLYELLYINGKPRQEKNAQQLFFGIANSYCEAYNFDISPEANSGRGPVDFKFSKGYFNKILVEIKLTSNTRLMHGFEKQLKEYGKSEKTDKLIFLVINNGEGEERLKKLKERYEQEKKQKIKIPLLTIVDAKPKKSASKY